MAEFSMKRLASINLRKDSNTMNQADLIHNTAGISGESKKATEAVLKAATDVIAATLKAGE